MKRMELGRLGERLARSYLEEKGYTVLSQNYRTKLGEIDLVVKKNETIIFVEVRTRSSAVYGTPQESIDRYKQEKLIRLALQFCAHHYLYSQDLRFDVIAITLQDNEPKIEHIPNAFWRKEKQRCYQR